MIEDFKTVTLGNTLLKPFKGLILEFDNPSTLETDQVIMMALSRSGFILSFPISKFSLGRKTETGEELKSSIDRGIANFGIDFRHLGVDLSEVLMPMGVEKDDSIPFVKAKKN